MVRKIIITGGTGFIGSHLAELLASKKLNVTVFDRYNANYNLGNLSNSKFKKKINFIFGDIRDYDSVFNALKGQDVVCHLAALIGIPYSYISPMAYIKTNVEGTYNVLESAKNLNLKKVLITSTSEVYGSAIYTPINERHPLQPQSPYSASKISADNLALSYFNSFNTPVTIMRPFNTFGPRQSERAIIPTIINQIINSKKGNINLGNLHPIREFNYVEDVTAAYVKAINSKKIAGKVINIGGGTDISIKKLVLKISKIIKKKVIVKRDKKRVRGDKSEVKLLKSSNRLAKKILKWKPRYIGEKGFDKSLKKTIKWFENPDNNQSNNYKKYII